MSKITLLTTAGRNMLAGAVANAQSIPSARIVVGDGNGVTYVPVASQTALVNQVWEGSAAVAVTEDKVFFQATIPIDAGPFTVREAGVLLGDAGAEQLFIVSQYNVTEKLASPSNGAGPITVTIAFTASASETAVLPVSQGVNSILALSNSPHITVKDLATSAPAEPGDGDLYAIASGATGLFAGKGGQLAERVGGAWLFRQPPVYSVVRLMTDGSWKERVGSNWIPYGFPSTAVDWSGIVNKPTTFDPSAHTHPQSDVIGLVAELAAKTPTARLLTTDGLIKIAGGNSADLSADRALSLDVNALKAQLGIGRKIIAIGTLTSSPQAITFAETEPDTLYSAVGLYVVPTGDGVQNTVGAVATVFSKTVSGFTFSSSVPAGAPASYVGFYAVFR